MSKTHRMTTSPSIPDALASTYHAVSNEQDLSRCKTEREQWNDGGVVMLLTDGGNQGLLRRCQHEDDRDL